MLFLPYVHVRIFMNNFFLNCDPPLGLRELNSINHFFLRMIRSTGYPRTMLSCNFHLSADSYSFYTSRPEVIPSYQIYKEFIAYLLP